MTMPGHQKDDDHQHHECTDDDNKKEDDHHDYFQVTTWIIHLAPVGVCFLIAGQILEMEVMFFINHSKVIGLSSSQSFIVSIL